MNECLTEMIYKFTEWAAAVEASTCSNKEHHRIYDML